MAAPGHSTPASDGLDDRSIAELNTRYTAREMAGLFSLGAQWVWETGPDHCYTYVSPMLCDVTGIDPAMLLGKSRREIYLSGTNPDITVIQHLEDLDNHRPFRDFTFRAANPAGAEHWICISGLPRRDEAGKFLGYLGVGRSLNDTSLQTQALQVASARLKRTERLLSDMFSALPVGLAIYDDDDRLLMSNPRLEAMYPGLEDVFRPGTPMGVILDRAHRLFGFVEPHQDADDVRRAWVKAKIEDYRKDSHEGVEQRADGRYVHHTVRRLPSGYTASLRVDITSEITRERQIAEAREAERQARSRLESAVRSLAEGFAVWDKDDRLVICNASYREMVSPEIAIEAGMAYSDMVRRLGWSGTVEGIEGHEDRWIAEQLSARNGNDIDAVYRIGSRRWILRRDVRMPNGERVDFRTDVTEIKDSERRIADALDKARLTRDVISALDEPIFVKDSALRFVVVNDAFARIFGKTADDFAGLTAADVISPDAASQFEANERAVIETGIPFEAEEDFFEAGIEKARIVRKSRVISPNGAVHLVGYLIDITELRQRERELRDASRLAQAGEKAKSDFLANMSHAIRTPLNGVIAMADLLARDALDMRQRTFVDIIRKSGQTLLDSICDILDFARLDAGELELKPVEFAPVDLIDDAARLASLEAARKDINLVVHVHPGMPDRVIGDAARLRQILSNLLSNAVKFTEAGEVVLEARVCRQDATTIGLAITVRDTGCGMDTAEREDIFNAFSQGDAGARRGFGIGLAITARLLALMGGRCTVDSAPGVGSTFTVEFDLQVAEGQDRSSAALRAALAQLEGRRMIVLDRSEARRASWKSVLSGCGVDAVSVETPELVAAMVAATARSGRPADLVIHGGGEAVRDQIERALEPVRAAMPHGVPNIVSAVPLADLLSKGKAGADLQISLPLRRRQLARDLVGLLADRTGEAQLHPPGREATRPRVDMLIAEDNEINQLVYAHILGRTGLAYEIVADGAAALEAVRSNRPALVLADIDLPDMDGFELARSIRAQAGPGIPVIAVGAPMSDDDRAACIRAGMVDVLVKPISQESLLAIIAKWSGQAGRRAG